MEQRHLIVVDEQSQTDRLERMCRSLGADGIQLIYQEINPNKFINRQKNGDLKIDRDALKGELRSIPFLPHLDVFATDYNLVDEELKGIDLIEMFYEISPYYQKKVVIYSAQIEEVINNIITKRVSGFEQQVSMLKLLAQNKIDYLSSDGKFEQIFKNLIVDETDITIEARLAESLQAIDNDKFKCSIPKYSDKRLKEIGELLLAKDKYETIKLKKEITDHIMAYITSIQDYE